MSVTTLHELYAVTVNAVFMDQVSDYMCSLAVQEAIANGDGLVDPTFVATGSQAPRLSWTSSKVATILGSCGISGLALSSTLTAFFQQITKGGTRAGASSHIRLTVNEGLVLPRTLNADQASASLSLECIATYDGTNNPIVIAAGQSLTGTPSVTEQFVAGPVSINGTTLNAVQSITIDFGIAETVAAGDGQVWPTFVAIGERRPRITIQSLDVGFLNTTGISGVAQSASDSVIFLRKVAKGATRVADDTAKHISFTIDDGMIITRSVGGSHGSPQMAEIEIIPTYDGSNAIMAIDTTAAIA